MVVFGIVIAILIVFFAVIDIIDINRFVKKEYVIESDKLNKEYCIVFLSDLHNRQFGKDNSKLLAAIDEISPDFICCGGDMIVARPNFTYDVAMQLMSNMKKRPVYYGIGNHEYRWKIYREEYGDLYSEYVKELESVNVDVLENDSLIFDENIKIQGIMIGKEYYKRFEKKNMDSKYVNNICGPFDIADFNILLAHNPEYFPAYAESGADLVLAGHVHGGIMRLPIVGGVISPRLGLFPHYTGGRYEKDGSTMILSCGLGCHTLPLRIFNPGELSIIRLKPCSK